MLQLGGYGFSLVASATEFLIRCACLSWQLYPRRRLQGDVCFWEITAYMESTLKLGPILELHCPCRGRWTSSGRPRDYIGSFRTPESRKDDFHGMDCSACMILESGDVVQQTERRILFWYGMFNTGERFVRFINIQPVPWVLLCRTWRAVL